MKYNWDIKILNPIIFIILILSFILLIKKNKKIQKDIIFLLQQLCFWTATYLVIVSNNNFIILKTIEEKYNPLIIMFFSTLFYSIFATIFANILNRYFKNRKIWFFISHIVIFISLICFLFLNSFIFVLFLSFSIALCAGSFTQYYLFYSENYHKRFFPFFVISLFMIVNIFSTLVSSNFFNFLNFIFNYKESNSLLLKNTVTIIGFILFCFSFIIMINIKNKKSLFGFSYEQKNNLEPFIWPRAFLIFFFLFIISFMEAISHSQLSDWILKQNTYTYFRDKAIINLFSRLSNTFYFLTEIIFATFIGIFSFKKIGVKYTFYIGLSFLFIYYVLMAFNGNPILLLILTPFQAIGYIIVYISLLSLLVMWNSRSFNKNLPTIGSFISITTHFSLKYIIFIIIKHYNVNLLTKNYILDDRITSSLNSETTFIFTSFAISVLILWILFYFKSNFILGEYIENSKNSFYLIKKDKNILISKKYFN